jgi:CRP/FNR family cyclic AMP-dependent transcriptional regulator
MDSWPAGSVLGTLPAVSREALLRLGVGTVYESGRRIIAEGDESTFVVLISAGCTKVTGRLEDGREGLLALRARGDLVGELAAFDGRPRAASVIACSIVRGRVITRGDFLRYLRTHPDANLAVNAMLGERLRQAIRRRLDFAGSDAPVRIARVLVEISETYGRPARDGLRSGVRLAQHELATLSGTSRETVERTLHVLRAEGILVTAYREFTVVDRGALYKYAHLDPQTVRTLYHVRTGVTPY